MFLFSYFSKIDHERNARFPSPVKPRLLRRSLAVLGPLLLGLTSYALATDVTLSWNDPNNSASAVGGYNLYHWQTGMTQHVTNVGDQKTYTLSGLTAGQTYHFAVTAHDGNGGRESAFSNETTYTIPTASPPSPPPPSPPPPPPPTGNAFLQDSGSNGLVAIEAEQFHNRTSQGGHSWTQVSRSGASGAGAMEATPNSGTINNTGYVTGSPRLDFQVQFTRTGTHYVWIRGIGSSNSDDSVHVGLDGQAVSSSDRLQLRSSTWQWSKSTMDGPVATIQVTSAGIHTVNVWMREDGFVFDKIVLTTSASYTPSGTGPGSSSTTDDTGGSGIADNSGSSGSTGSTGDSGSTGTSGGSNTANNTDSDNDGFPDNLESHYGTNPSNPGSIPALTDLVVRGETSVTSSWKHVTLSPPFLDPVVIAKPLSSNNSDPAVVRIRNVQPAGFDIRAQEWDYLDGPHATETVGYLVMERGSFLFKDNTGQFVMVEADTFDTNRTSFITVPFSQSFNTPPVVVTTVTSTNEASAVTARLRNIGRTGFQFRLQEQESNGNSHATETNAYIAWEPCTGTIDGMAVDVDKTGSTVTQSFYTINFNRTFNSAPVFLADMQTTDEGDTANLRWQHKGSTSVKVQVDEEQSQDSETDHNTEVVGYIAIR